MTDLDAPVSWQGLEIDPADLRADVEAMAWAVCQVVVADFPGVRAVYFKGSAAQKWDTPLDYVAELSDIDLHLDLSDDKLDDVKLLLADLDASLRRHERIEAAFRSRRPNPVHVPRVQVIILNDLVRLIDYLPSPPGAVRTLFGEPYPAHGPLDEAAVAGVEARRLLDSADQAVIDQAISDLIERPGSHLFHLLRALSWRISPVASRVLSVRGLDYDSAWTNNRSTCLRNLSQLGERDLADLLSKYYSSAWLAQRSGWADTAPGRQAFRCGVLALRRSREVAEHCSLD